jgi:hypothetical protein
MWRKEEKEREVTVSRTRSTCKGSLQQIKGEMNTLRTVIVERPASMSILAKRARSQRPVEHCDEQEKAQKDFSIFSDDRNKICGRREVGMEKTRTYLDEIDCSPQLRARLW